MIDYSFKVGVIVVDADGNDASDVLEGSPNGEYVGKPGPPTRITITDDQLGENVLLSIPDFEVDNADVVTVTITTSTGSTFISNVS